MEIQTSSIQMKIRKIYPETLKVSELKKRGVKDLVDEEASVANKAANELEDDEIVREVLACPDTIDKEEKDIIAFVNNQLERMQLIWYQLLSMPDQDIDVSPECILSIPHGQRSCLCSVSFLHFVTFG